MISLLERLRKWLRGGCFELYGPVVVKDGSAWLRLAPGQPPSWWKTEAEALSA